MALSKGTKYAIANIGLGALLYLALRFYYDAPLQSAHGAKVAVLEAVLLYIAAGILIAARAYYRSIRFNASGQIEKGANLHAYGLFGADRLKHISLSVRVNEPEFAELAETGTLALAPERFNMPVRDKDSVTVRYSSGKLSKQIPTLITKIDGINQKVVLSSSRSSVV